MGKQRVRTVAAETVRRDEPLTARRYLKPCPLSVLGVECSSDARLPSAPAEAFGDMAAAFPSTDAIREAGGYAMALALADQPVPSSLCCDRPPTPPATARWH